MLQQAQSSSKVYDDLSHRKGRNGIYGNSVWAPTARQLAVQLLPTSGKGGQQGGYRVCEGGRGVALFLGCSAIKKHLLGILFLFHFSVQCLHSLRVVL